MKNFHPAIIITLTAGIMLSSCANPCSIKDPACQELCKCTSLECRKSCEPAGIDYRQNNQRA